MDNMRWFHSMMDLVETKRFPLQQEKEFGSYPIVPQQEKPGPEMTTPLQQVLRLGL
jgi:hypothetical protein